jgi:hypothetical protein
MGSFLLECGFRSVHCDSVVSSITVWKSKVKVFDVQVHEGEDKLHARNIHNDQCKEQTAFAKTKRTGNQIKVHRSQHLPITLSLMDFQNTRVISSPAHRKLGTTSEFGTASRKVPT